MSPSPERIVPEKGIEIALKKRQALAERSERLARQIIDLKGSLISSPLSALIPDVEIYYFAVRYALDHDIFFEESDAEIAETFLSQGQIRAEQLKHGNAPWTTATGQVVRGYRSRLDDSIQPYGLTVPDSFTPDTPRKHRLDIWHHGRGAKLSELRFIDGQQNKPGEFSPPDTFVLHTYGRWSNAMKFAGEVDTFEALAHAKTQYPIDEDRICVRGFSMGGAATWHQGVHHASTWAAANPGAGFAETAVYQNVFAKDPHPPLWEQKLWNLYDATVCAGNFHQCPVVAYSGELDKQMQAADIMADYMAREGLGLQHIIGPGMGHKFHPDSKVEIDQSLAEIVARGRNRSPEKIRFTTYTLRYNRMCWVEILGLETHWERAQWNADVIDPKTLQIATRNVLSFALDTDLCPVGPGASVMLDGQSLPYSTRYVKDRDLWAVGGSDQETLCKKHGLQGPIDDAFMEPFLFVTPTGTPTAAAEVSEWTAGQQANAIYQWEMQFRGRPRVKRDVDVTDEDIENFNLALWGDPGSNAILGKIAHALPIQWQPEGIAVGHQVYDGQNLVPVFAYPNPLQPNRYSVVNSGFTFAPNGSQSNATQTPKLPDWAVVDVTVDPTDPARIKAADFFDEQWQCK
ncbi:MAG: prolyl oligopeptidase family serine peptidase [bacterium]|nr:prolyl oligopeptidase family serine peptidase [bacterium]